MESSLGVKSLKPSLSSQPVFKVTDFVRICFASTEGESPNRPGNDPGRVSLGR